MILYHTIFGLIFRRKFFIFENRKSLYYHVRRSHRINNMCCTNLSGTIITVDNVTRFIKIIFSYLRRRELSSVLRAAVKTNSDKKVDKNRVISKRFSNCYRRVCSAKGFNFKINFHAVLQ